MRETRLYRVIQEKLHKKYAKKYSTVWWFTGKKGGVLCPKSFMYGPTVYPGIKVEMGVSFACFMHIYTIFSVLFVRSLLFLLKLKFVRIEITPPLECMLSICECLDFILSSTTKESNTNLFLDLVCLHSHISRYVNHYQMVTSLKSNSLNFSTLHFLNLFRLP